MDTLPTDVAQQQPQQLPQEQQVQEPAQQRTPGTCKLCHSTQQRGEIYHECLFCKTVYCEECALNLPENYHHCPYCVIKEEMERNGGG